MSEEIDDIKAKGSPSWMTTFADLMSLLMCFFVLLLSYSEMDVEKFKQIAGSMKYAFGVQREVIVEEVPKGTSVVANEFSPSVPAPTPINNVVQNTASHEQPFLQSGQIEQAQNEQNEALKKHLEQVFAEEIADDMLELELLGQQLIIRLKEHGTFPSGSSFLQPRFKPVLLKIASELNDIPGKITVSGHTDNRPVRSELHANNWDLSAKRAAAVLTTLLSDPVFDSTRVKLEARADTVPLKPNSSANNRAQNRRVEIMINQGQATELAPISFN